MRETQFPDIYTEWTKMKDIKPADAYVITEYLNAIKNERPDLAGAALAKIKNKVLQTRDWQEFCDVADEMEQFITDMSVGGTWKFTEYAISSTTPNNAAEGFMWIDTSASSAPCTSIVLSDLSNQLILGTSTEATITAVFNTASDDLTTDTPTWTSSNTSVFNVTSYYDCCKLTAVSNGTATLTVTCGNQTATKSITVSPALNCTITCQQGSSPPSAGYFEATFTTESGVQTFESGSANREIIYNGVYAGSTVHLKFGLASTYRNVTFYYNDIPITDKISYASGEWGTYDFTCDSNLTIYISGAVSITGWVVKVITE